MEFLNKLTPSGLLPHHLYIKKGVVLTLLRSLSPKQELCNSTRLIHNKATNILLYSKIASGDYAREEVLIPGIEIKHQDEQFIERNQHQFPVWPASAMTINNSQCKTLENGILARGAYIHSWAALCHGLNGRRASISSFCSKQER